MPAIVSEGSVASVTSTPMTYTAPFTSSLDLYTGFSDYADIFMTQPNVRTVVHFLGRNIAQLGLHTFRRTSDSERQRLNDHPLAKLIEQPNPFTTRYRMIEALVQDLCIYGNAYWFKMYVNGKVTGIMRLFPGYVQPRGSSIARVDDYVYQASGGRVVIDPAQVVHFRFYHPNDGRIGVSPLQALRRILAEEGAAGDYREKFWRNGAKVSGSIERPADAPTWSKDARGRFIEDTRAKFSGTGPEVGGWMLLEDGMTLKEGGQSAKDSQYLETRKFTLEETARAFYIPPPAIGILDRATFSNVEELHRNLYQDTLGPWLTMISEDVELQLLPDMADNANVYVEFNLEEKMKGSFEAQAAAYSLAGGGPWMLADEIRARSNLPPLGGGASELVTPSNVIRGGGPQAAPNAPQPKSFAEVAADFVRRQKRHLDAGRPFADLRWEHEFALDLAKAGVHSNGSNGKASDNEIHLHMPDIPDVQVNVDVPPVELPPITVEPQISVNVPDVHVEPNITVVMPKPGPRRIERDDEGRPIRIIEEDR